LTLAVHPGRPEWDDQQGPTLPSSHSACDQQWTLVDADRPETAVTDTIHINPAVALSKLKKRAKVLQRTTGANRPSSVRLGD